MAVTKYTFSIAGDTPNGKADPDSLQSQIVADAAIVIAPSHVNTSGDVLDVFMKGSLDSPQQTALTALVNAHDGTPIETPMDVKVIDEAPRDGMNRPFAVVWPTEGSKSTKVSHRWNDATTWHQEATEHTSQSASAITAGTSYQLPHTNIIDTYHGKIWAEDDLGMRVTVRVDGVEKTENDPHDGAGDYSLDYTTGVLTFNPTISIGAAVEADYHASGSSLFTVKPAAGKRLTIQSAEVQFADDTDMNDTVHFDLYGLVEVFAPHLTPSPYPAGTLIQLKRTTYKTLYQFMDESNGAFPTIPALGGASWRGNQRPVTVFPWDYQAVMGLDASKGMEIRIMLGHDQPFGGSYCTCTMYCLSEDEPI